MGSRLWRPAFPLMGLHMTKRKAPDECLPSGRPTDYRPEYAEQAYKLCLLGATDKAMADFFRTSEQTLNAWKAAQPKFLEALRAGKAKADAEMAHSLYHRGKGYSHEAVKIFMPAGATEPVYAPYIERYPPDTQAASLWLRNRQPGIWREKTEHEHTGKDGGPIEMSIDDRRARAQAMLQAAFGEEKDDG